ncbi:ROK family protein [Schaalia naturae]|jgi:predicted NBD/HSP70 family sugar kinase|uniref:ROK family protein n=1 Tax=Schaalia naturae TaxID=635203 RepID=A0ABW2SNK4_9ACTO
MTHTIAATADVRRANASRVFGHLLDTGPASRTEIREATGLVSGTVGAIVHDLIARGLVVEEGDTVPTAGRPRRILAVASGRVLGARARIHPTDLEVDLIDLAGRRLWGRTVGHHAATEGPHGLVAALCQGLQEAQDRAGRIDGAWFAGSIVITLGPVARESTVVVSLDLPLAGLDLRTAIQQRLSPSHDVRVVNDGRLGALAEYWSLPAGVRSHTMAYINSGFSGVSGGVVQDGAVLGGGHGLAGEVGHIVVDKNGPRCTCGARGCLTTFLRTSVMLAKAGVVLDEADTRGSRPLDRLAGLLEQVDPAALAAVAAGAEALEAAVATLSNLADVDLVVLGGHLPRLRPWLHGAIDNLIARRAAVSPVFNPVVRDARFAADAEMRGAWLMMRSRVVADPLAVPLLD